MEFFIHMERFLIAGYNISVPYAYSNLDQTDEDDSIVESTSDMPCLIPCCSTSKLIHVDLIHLTENGYRDLPWKLNVAVRSMLITLPHLFAEI